MFSKDARCYLQNHQLGEVICQLRFPEILMIGEKAPAAFQERIRDEYPQYSVRKDTPAPKITGAPGHFTLENTPATVNYQFVSADGVWRVNLTSTFISLACSRYTGWEDFAKKLDKPLAAFIQVYKPAFFQRIGLRYLNFFSRKELELENLNLEHSFSSEVDAADRGPHLENPCPRWCPRCGLGTRQEHTREWCSYSSAFCSEAFQTRGETERLAGRQ